MKQLFIVVLLTFNTFVIFSQEESNYASTFAHAKQLFKKGNYEEALENFESALKMSDAPPNAKVEVDEWIKKCKDALTTLSVSKINLSFSSIGGGDNITVSTNASSYSVSGLPTWCSIQEKEKNFIITCSANPETSPRSKEFTVTAGDKSVMINIRQTGKTPPRPATTLNVSKTELPFLSSGGMDSIVVNTNAGSYSISGLPAWCFLQEKVGYFVIQCKSNSEISPRSKEFSVTAGDKTVKINISQPGKTPPSPPPATTLKVSKTELPIPSSGGNGNILVTTNASTYSVSGLPTWCSIQENKENFIITCSANTETSPRAKEFTVTAGDKTVKINISQTGKTPASPPPATILSVSKTELPFLSSGGNGNVTVTTNANSYSVSGLPSWCTLEIYAEYFVITCSANPETSSRSREFSVTAGDKTVKININQTGKTPPPPPPLPPPATTLRVSETELPFLSSGGSSKQIIVYSNANTYSISYLPSWCSVQTYNGHFVVTCSVNYSNQSRSDLIKVKAGDKEEAIYVTQEGKSISKKFNSTDDDPRPLGLSLGYVQKQWDWETDGTTTKYGAFDGSKKYIDGIQVGVRFEPLFKYGLGLNTGLFYEHYFAKSGLFTETDLNYTMNFNEHSLYLPLHLEYRANITDNFSIFTYGGASIDYGLGARISATEKGENEPFYTETDVYQNSEIGFPNRRLNASIDFGAGFRVGGLQLNIASSRGLMDISNDRNVVIKQNKPLTVSLSWMIPQEDTPVNSPGTGSYDQFASIEDFGITLGYVSKQWEYSNEKYTEKMGLWENAKFVPGLRIGYIYQPNFVYGFGLRTGLNFDTYFAISNDMYDDVGSYNLHFTEVVINVPLHVIYRLYFARNFSMFFETGISGDIGVLAKMDVKSDDSDSYTENDLYGKSDWGYPNKRFNGFLDIAGGFRIKNMQFSAGISRGLTPVTFTDAEDYEWKTRLNRNFQFEFSWFFNE